MRINVHTHIFNFKSVFTERTVRVLLNRLGAEGWPDFVVDAAVKVVMQVISGKELDEEELLSRFADEISASKKFKAYIKDLGGNLPAPMRILVDGDLDGLATGALRELLHKLTDTLSANNDTQQKTIDDLIAFLAIGIRPTMHEIAEILMQQSGNETTCVALMFDATEGETADEKLFRAQVEETAQASIAFPGRLIPFIAVNTLRKSHFQHLERAVLERGFAGVKLYPSLGYEMDTPLMRKVYEFCAQNDVPLLLHCNRGGFYFTKADIEFCNPRAWKDVLADFQGLRVCFGHFGGDENLVQPVIPPNSWTAAILELMEQHSGVYADIAYHTDCMAGGDAEKNYFTRLGELLARPTIRDRVLFGSDFFLVRQQLREDNLWRYFETKFSAAEFQRITVANPRAFLGLPNDDGTGAKPNILRHLRFLAENNTEVEATPLPWVTAALKVETGEEVRFVVNPFGPRWTYKKHAHWYTDQFFRSLLGNEVASRLTWLQTGSMLTRELPGWPPEQVSKENRQQVFRSFAREMHMFLVQDSVGAQPEQGVTRVKAESTLSGMFASADTQLFQFGKAVDRLYRFKDENKA